MKTEINFKEVIRDIGCDPFFIHYCNPEQIHIYRNYCRQNKNPQLIIDATGSVVKRFTKFGINKTNPIFLYEAVVYDDKKKHSFTVTSMLSERHTTIAIFNWLARWMSFNVTQPKQTVSDQSLALLSAITQCFTQYSSLESYIKVCSDIISNVLPVNSYWMPRCFIRVDVAHFIKLVCKWPPLKLLTRRVRELILRSIGLLVKSQDIKQVHTLLLSLFTVITNETDGDKLSSNINTQCEIHKKILITATATGITDIHKLSEKIMAEIQNEENIEIQHDDEQFYEFDDINPFKAWAEEIYEKSKDNIEEGNSINAMYVPSLVPHILKIMKFLPLWSGIMVPIFGYGESVSSSAAVESNFQKLKNVTFKHISLPTDAETFIENHILSLRGTALIRSTDANTSTDTLISNIVMSDDSDSKKNNITKTIALTCPLCKTGSFPTEKGAHKCIFCKSPVHALSSCSYQQPDEEDKRICFNCFKDKNNENSVIEKWNKRPLKSNSYLMPNPHLRHLDLNIKRNEKTLPLLKNGSRAEELKGIKIKGLNGNVIFSNTCAFDAITSLVMVSFCDSELYSNGLLEHKTKYIDFVSNLVCKGVTSNSYSERAEIIINFLNPDREILQDNTALIMCDMTATTVLKNLLSEMPSLQESSKCSNQKCEKYIESIHSFSSIVYQTSGIIENLQQFLNKRLVIEESLCNKNISNSQICNSKKYIVSKISTKHIFVEILLWNGTLI